MSKMRDMCKSKYHPPGWHVVRCRKNGCHDGPHSGGTKSHWVFWDDNGNPVSRKAYLVYQRTGTMPEKMDPAEVVRGLLEIVEESLEDYFKSDSRVRAARDFLIQ